MSKSFTDIIGERFTHPYYLAFVLSWVSFNWEFVYLFFRPSDNPGYSIQLLESKLNLYEGLIYPIISSLFILLLVPMIQYIVDWWTMKVERQKGKLKRQEKVHEIENEITVLEKQRLVNMIVNEDISLETFYKMISECTNMVETHLVSEINYAECMNLLSEVTVNLEKVLMVCTKKNTGKIEIAEKITSLINIYENKKLRRVELDERVKKLNELMPKIKDYRAKIGFKVDEKSDRLTSTNK